MVKTQQVSRWSGVEGETLFQGQRGWGISCQDGPVSKVLQKSWKYNTPEQESCNPSCKRSGYLRSTYIYIYINIYIFICLGSDKAVERLERAIVSIIQCNMSLKYQVISYVNLDVQIGTMPEAVIPHHSHQFSRGVSVNSLCFLHVLHRLSPNFHNHRPKTTTNHSFPMTRLSNICHGLCRKTTELALCRCHFQYLL